MGGAIMQVSQLVVIGAGPGGIAAVTEAAKAGVRVTLLDENPKAGGQIYRQFDAGLRVTDPERLGRDYDRGRALLREFGMLAEKVEYLSEAMIWGLFDNNNLAFQHNGASQRLGFEHLILAAGAYDRPVPFPGWTLPGVFTAGGCQRLVKMQGVLPGEKILLAGTGPLQLVLADQITRAGGKVVAILEAGHIDYSLQSLKGIWGNWELLGDALHYRRSIRKAGVPFLWNHLILEARGDDSVAEAVITEVDKDWRPIPNRRHTLKVDTICLGYGFVPSVELSLQAGCDHEYLPHLGGWVPVCGEKMETSLPHIYSVGDGSGVAGSKAALLEGRIAGLAVAHSLGYLTHSKVEAQIAHLRKDLRRINRLRRVLDKMSRPRPGLYELACDDTIICRCEEVTYQEIIAAISEDRTNTINDLKRMTRAGMGRCQGRMCVPAVMEILSRRQKTLAWESKSLRPRPPAKPVSLGILSEKTKSK